MDVKHKMYIKRGGEVFVTCDSQEAAQRNLVKISVGDMLWECSLCGKLFYHKVMRVTTCYFWSTKSKVGQPLSAYQYRNSLSELGERIFHTPEECLNAFIARKNEELAAKVTEVTKEITTAREALAALEQKGVEHGTPDTVNHLGGGSTGVG